MSDISGLGSGASSYASMIQQLQQQIFSRIDANGDGSITKTEMEQAVTAAGGTTQSADALYAALDPNNTGSVSQQQFDQNLPPLPVFSPGMGATLIADQAQATSGSSTTDPTTGFAANLFNQLDANGDGTLTQSELEQAVTAAGGTKASADALYAQLDPNNTGSVSEQQFAANLPKLGHHHHFHGSGDQTANASGTDDDGDSAQDALDELFQAAAGSSTGSTGTDPLTNLFSQLDSNGDGTLTQSELEQAVTAAGGTKASADALYTQLDPNNTGSVSEQQFVANLPKPGHHHHGGGDATAAAAGANSDGNSADDALAALFQATAASSSATGTDAADLFSSFDSLDGQSLSQSALDQVTPGASTVSPESALQALIDNLGTTTSGTSDSNSAAAALQALWNADGSSASNNASATASSAGTSASNDPSSSSPAALFGKFNASMLAMMLQMQSQSFFG